MATALVESTQIGMLTLLALPDTGYRLRKAIAVQVERDECGSFVVSEPTTGAFHYDQDLSRAVAGFFGAFVEEFQTLEHHHGPLSPAMSSLLEQFRLLVEPATK